MERPGIPRTDSKVPGYVRTRVATYRKGHIYLEKQLAEVKVHRENVEKADDFYFFDIRVSFRALPNLIDGEKDREIKAAKYHLSAIKQVVINVLANNNRLIVR